MEHPDHASPPSRNRNHGTAPSEGRWEVMFQSFAEHQRLVTERRDLEHENDHDQEQDNESRPELRLSATMKKWVENQRYQYGLLQKGQKSAFTNYPERIARLRSINFDFGQSKDEQMGKWGKMYGALVLYKLRNGDCNVPVSHDKALGNWVSWQRTNYWWLKEGNKRSSITPHRIAMLEKLGFQWRISKQPYTPTGGSALPIFEQRVQELREFKEQHGHIDIRQSDPDHRDLARFIKYARGRKSSLAQDRIDQLESIEGWTWKKIVVEGWDAMFEQLKSHMEKNGGSCNFPWTGGEEYKKLNAYISRQRTMYKRFQEGKHSQLTPERIRRLNSIGFVWNARKGKRKSTGDDDKDDHVDVHAKRSTEGDQADDATDDNKGRVAVMVPTLPPMENFHLDADGASVAFEGGADDDDDATLTSKKGKWRGRPPNTEGGVNPSEIEGQKEEGTSSSPTSNAVIDTDSVDGDKQSALVLSPRATRAKRRRRDLPSRGKNLKIGKRTPRHSAKETLVAIDEDTPYHQSQNTKQQPKNNSNAEQSTQAASLPCTIADTNVTLLSEEDEKRDGSNAGEKEIPGASKGGTKNDGTISKPETLHNKATTETDSMTKESRVNNSSTSDGDQIDSTKVDAGGNPLGSTNTTSNNSTLERKAAKVCDAKEARVNRMKALREKRAQMTLRATQKEASTVLHISNNDCSGKENQEKMKSSTATKRRKSDRSGKQNRKKLASNVMNHGIQQANDDSEDANSSSLRVSSRGSTSEIASCQAKDNLFRRKERLDSEGEKSEASNVAKEPSVDNSHVELPDEILDPLPPVDFDGGDVRAAEKSSDEQGKVAPLVEEDRLAAASLRDMAATRENGATENNEKHANNTDRQTGFFLDATSPKPNEIVRNSCGITPVSRRDRASETNAAFTETACRNKAKQEDNAHDDGKKSPENHSDSHRLNDDDDNLRAWNLSAEQEDNVTAGDQAGENEESKNEGSTSELPSPTQPPENKGLAPEELSGYDSGSANEEIRESSPKRSNTSLTEENQLEGESLEDNMDGGVEDTELQDDEHDEPDEQHHPSTPKPRVPFEERFAQLAAYSLEKGRSKIPSVRENKELHNWARQQRKSITTMKGRRKGKGNKLTSDVIEVRKAMMDSIEFPWDGEKDTWEVMFEKLKSYKDEHGSCDVPTSSGKLGKFVSHQRTSYKHFKEGKPSAMTEERIDALESIGFQWITGLVKSKQSTFEDRCLELEVFRLEYGHTNVPRTFKDHPQLGAWLKKQRIQYRLFKKGAKSQMTEAKIARLERIDGFQWDVIKKK